MSTDTTTPGIDLHAVADHEAVMRHVIEGTPVEMELARRVQVRSQRIMEETRRKYGEVDVDALLHAVRDEE